MDVPCPKCNSTDLQKVFLACEEVLRPCGKRAQFHGIVVQMPVATGVSKSLLAARRQNQVAGRTFRAES